MQLGAGKADSTLNRKPSVDVYHCNDKPRLLKYISEKELIVSKEDGHWLGTGMYFWDNLSNAKYWKREKEKKAKKESINIGYTIANNLIEFEKKDLLDLTDSEVAKSMQEAWLILAETIGENPNVSVGKKLNQLSKFVGGFDVIKAAAKYNSIDDSEFFSATKRKRASLTSKIRMIYLIKTDNSILLPITEIEG